MWAAEGRGAAALSSVMVVCADTSVAARRVLGAPGRAGQVLCVWCVMCAEPGVKAEELLLLGPRKKHLSGQQKTEIRHGKA